MSQGYESEKSGLIKNWDAGFNPKWSALLFQKGIGFNFIEKLCLLRDWCIRKYLMGATNYGCKNVFQLEFW